MGEYGLTETGERIKIGTCSEMLYLRYEDRHRIRPASEKFDHRIETGLLWRIPFPDEDNVQPGYYESERCLMLPYDFEKEMKGCENHPGRFQLRNENLGIQVSMKCYHNAKLPENTEDYRACWNGKGPAFSLTSIKNTKDGIRFIVSCNGCGESWICSGGEILPYIQNSKLKARLAAYLEAEKPKAKNPDTWQDTTGKATKSKNNNTSLLSWSF